MTSLDAGSAAQFPPSQITTRAGRARVGRRDGPTDFQALVGHCEFQSPDSALLVALLPEVVHVQSSGRLHSLVHLLSDEWQTDRPARDMVLTRLMEVLLLEALRTASQPQASPGLLRGLADPNLAGALRVMHLQPDIAWTVGRLATKAAMSRSTFFARFSQSVGVAPMAYLLNWRMAIAKSLLRQRQANVAEVAERVGYGSASAFSIAFSRHTGMAPGRYARAPEA